MLQSRLHARHAGRWPGVAGRWPITLLVLVLSGPLQAQTNEPWASFTAGGPDFAYMAFPGETVSVNINGASSENLTYAWDLGDGRSSNEAAPTFAYDQAGVYQITLVVRDDQGQSGLPFRRWLFVQDPRISANSNEIPPWPFINRPENGAHLPVDQTVLFQGHGFDSQNDAVTLFWDFGDGELARDTTEPRYRFRGEGTWNVNLFAVDAKGLVQPNLSFITIHLYREQAPAQGAILNPQSNNAVTGDYEVAVGTTVSLQGQVTVDATLGEADGYWNVLALATGEWTIYEGVSPPPITWPAGRYEAFFHATVRDRPELTDPIAPSVNIWIRDDNRPPFNATILEPNYDLTQAANAPLGLSAAAEDLDGDALCFKWTVARYPFGTNPALNFEGAFIDQVDLSEPGLYRIGLTVEDPYGGTTQARERFVAVRTANEENCAAEPIQITPSAPSETLLSGPRGVRYNFAVTLAGGQAATVLWDFGDGRLAEGATLADPVAFEAPGWYPIRVFVEDAGGCWSYGELYSLFVFGDDIPPTAEIVEPVCNAVNQFNACVYAVPAGSTVTLRGRAGDSDGQLPLSSVWWVNGEFYDIGETPPPLPLNQPGIYEVQYFVTDAAGLSNTFPSTRLIQVIDPNLRPLPEIVFPDADLTIAPGDSLRFEAFGEDPNGLALSYQWDFGGGARQAGADGAVVTAVTFPEPSPAGQPFVVSLTARTPFTTSAQAATMRITVARIADEGLEPNNSLDLAKPLDQGSYQDLRLTDGDPIDVYSFTLDGADRDLRFQIAAQGEALAMALYRRQGDSFELIQRNRAVADSFVVQQAPAGEYALELQLTSDPGKRRRNLGYGLTINTLRPALFLPFLAEDGNLQSSVGLLNPTGAEALLNIQGLSAEGEVVVEVTRLLPAGGLLRETATALFGGDPNLPSARAVRWVRVQSDVRVLGYLNGAGLDQTRLISVAGTASLSASVTIPHIANPDNGWYTRAIVINGGDRDDALQFAGPEARYPISENAKADGQVDFRFSQVLPAPLPGWGAFETPSGQARLAGVEVFGRTDMQREAAGIEMLPARRENPNFAYIGNDLYFTHIAADTLNWWTGISLINLSKETTRFTLTGYNTDGAVVFTQNDMSLPPGGKLLRTARDLFGNTPVDWLKVSGDGRLTGFELFGDHGLNRLAGLQAATALSDRLYYPHLNVTAGRTWTGISLLNVADTAVNVTVRAFDGAGVLVAESTRSLVAGGKWVALAQNLFPDSSALERAAYLRVEGDRAALCGFALFGTLSADGLGEQLAGLAAIPY